MELGQRMHLAPSTVTRLADKLELKGYIKRKSNGRNSNISATEKGIKIHEEIQKCWNDLYLALNRKLGKNKNDVFTKELFSISRILEQ